MSADRVRAIIVGAILVCLVLQAWLIFITEINWDEFFYLSHVYAFQRGELTGALQRLHVLLFAWLPAVPGDEIARVNVGRLVMLLCQAATCALIYRLARAFFDPVPALVAVLAFVSAGFTIVNGASFRADPLASALTMAALATLARSRMTAAALAMTALAAAAAALVTVKVVFYAPAFAAVAAWRVATARDRGPALRWLAALLGATLLAFAALYALQLSLMPKATNAAAQSLMASSGRTIWVEAGFLPRTREVLLSMMFAPVMTGLLLAGLVGAARSLASKRPRQWEDIVALASAGTLLSLLFYRNAYPYFFPFVWPPAMLLVAWIAQRIRRPRDTLWLAAAMTFSAMLVGADWARDRPREAQEQLISAVHRIFPQPLPYIDRNGIVSSFPKRGFFMSTWGLNQYRRGPPAFARLLASDTIPLLIANGPALERAMGVNPAVPDVIALQPEDEAVLRRNFIHHWGAIWVAGQTVRAGPGAVAFEVAVPGTYTVEGAPAIIDGKRVLPGGTVQLSRGMHALRSSAGATVTLRWGDRLPRPAEPAPADPVYRGFWP